MPGEGSVLAKLLGELREWWVLTMTGAGGGGLVGWVGGKLRERRRQEERICNAIREEGEATRKLYERESRRTREVASDAMKQVHARLDTQGATLGRIEGRLAARGRS